MTKREFGTHDWRDFNLFLECGVDTPHVSWSSFDFTFRDFISISPIFTFVRGVKYLLGDEIFVQKILMLVQLALRQHFQMNSSSPFHNGIISPCDTGSPPLDTYIFAPSPLLALETHPKIGLLSQFKVASLNISKLTMGTGKIGGAMLRITGEDANLSWHGPSHSCLLYTSPSPRD